MLFIRNCNVDGVIPDYDARLDQHLAIEGHWNKPIYEMFKARALNFPQRTKYFWYCGEEYNNACPDKTMNYVLHDNGTCAWAEHILDYSVSYNYCNWLESLPNSEFSPVIEEEEAEEEWA
jgi:hypothetical protein